MVHENFLFEFLQIEGFELIDFSKSLDEKAVISRLSVVCEYRDNWNNMKVYGIANFLFAHFQNLSYPNNPEPFLVSGRLRLTLFPPLINQPIKTIFTWEYVKECQILSN